MIGIIDYGMGNLRSVWNALDALALDAQVISDPEALERCDRVIVPGVGAFAAAMKQLNDRGLTEAIRGFAASGKPVLGICLGMQILVSTGTEPTTTPGLDLIPGIADRLVVAPPHRLPHVGWNTIQLGRSHPLFDGVKTIADFYFVHSYAVRPADDAAALARSEYSGQFVAAIAHRNVAGVQFHPEKSQTNGLRILENFAAWDGVC
jgi:imidazole glycerol-phosphate synthase subunit HisH